MEQYSTEEEQVAALKRWWGENGRSTIAALVIALAAVFGWQGWQANQLQQQEQASDLYQSLLRALGEQDSSPDSKAGLAVAEQLKNEFSSTTYAQFAALHLAALAVNEGKLLDAEEQLRWVLGKAEKGSDTEQIAQLRLARVKAAAGDSEQALDILAKAAPGPYGASRAAVRGDVLLAAGRKDEARDAYSEALALAGGAEQGVNLPTLQQKLQSLTPVPARALDPAVDETAPTNDTVDAQEK